MYFIHNFKSMCHLNMWNSVNNCSNLFRSIDYLVCRFVIFKPENYLVCEHCLLIFNCS